MEIPLFLPSFLRAHDQAGKWGGRTWYNTKKTLLNKILSVDNKHWQWRWGCQNKRTNEGKRNTATCKVWPWIRKRATKEGRVGEGLAEAEGEPYMGFPCPSFGQQEAGGEFPQRRETGSGVLYNLHATPEANMGDPRRRDSRSMAGWCLAFLRVPTTSILQEMVANQAEDTFSQVGESAEALSLQ